MKIGIDARLSGLQHAGIGRYTENLITQVLGLQTDDTWVFFFYSKLQAHEVLGNFYEDKRIKVVIAPIQHYTLSEQRLLPAIFSSENLDLLHVPHFNVPLRYSKPFVVTIHDLLWHEYRGQGVTTLAPWKYWIKYGFYRVVTRHAVTNARVIFVPARTIKDTVTKYFSATESKIIVTYEGADLRLQKFSEKKAAQLLAIANISVEHPFLLYVGSLYPHKNISVVLTALKELPHYRLYLAGSRDIFSDSVQKLSEKIGVHQQVVFLGRVTDDLLSALYSKTVALIQPSLSEGFGLTGVEALTLNTPVIASDIPIFHEIYQSAAVFFNPHDSQSLVKAVKAVESNPPNTKLESAYSWKKMAEQTYAGYQKALAT